MMVYLYWLAYAFLGWIVETTYVSVPTGKFVHRGFLYGPIIPIYGFGALSILFILMPFSSSPIFIFLLGILLTSVLEYITSYVMEKIFDMRWWDYSQRKFNINGRICLRNSILFGLLSLVLVEFIHPNMEIFLQSFSDKQLYQFAKISIFFVFIDFLLSVMNVIDFKENLQKVEVLYEELQAWMKKQKENTALQTLEKQVEELDNKINESLHELQDSFQKSSKELEKKHRRLLKSFPNIRSDRFDKILKQFKRKQ